MGQHADKHPNARAVNEYKKAVESGIDYAQKAAKNFLATPYDPKATPQTQTGATE